MRIGVLEWICGGGSQSIAPEHLPNSLRDEGWAMLGSVADCFAKSGHEVSMSLDPRLFSKIKLQELAAKFQLRTNIEFIDEVPASWWTIAADSDAVIVIAPEFSRVLQNAIELLTPVCELLFNCRGEFLMASCDKWLTSQRLHASHIRHPATQLLSCATQTWLDQNRRDSGRWILKPRDGAGCEGIQIVEEHSIHCKLALEQSGDGASQFLIQPMMKGDSYSRSVIVGSDGVAHWLPLVTQCFLVGETMHYQGGKVLAKSGQNYIDTERKREFPIEILNEILSQSLRALGSGALGWVGFDLLYDGSLKEWTVIESNPRLTTSFVGLGAALHANLMEQVLHACTGRPVTIGDQWRSVEFKLS